MSNTPDAQVFYCLKRDDTPPFESDNGVLPCPEIPISMPIYFAADQRVLLTDVAPFCENLNNLMLGVGTDLDVDLALDIDLTKSTSVRRLLCF